uniref:Uncharacterized protein n=1 Tax=Anolis carolinensis TaxID=28377 RepID=A0A803SRY5_ANOCA
MTTDSWALAGNEQEVAAESLSKLHLKEEQPKPDANAAVVKTEDHTEKPEGEEEVDQMNQQALNHKPNL